MTAKSDALRFMAMAFDEARAAESRGEVPIGAVVVHHKTGDVLARAGNRTLEHKDPTAHAEILAIRQACKQQGAQRIPECDLYVTLEPCTMCAGAIAGARIGHVYYGAADPKGGGVEHGAQFFTQPTCHHRPKIHTGFMADECAGLLKNFFKARRKF